jgi:hypothetical protein
MINPQKTQIALDVLGPILDRLRDAHMVVLQEAVDKQPENVNRIKALAQAVKTYGRIRSQLELTLAEGKRAEDAEAKAREFDKLSDERKRYLGIPLGRSS